MAKIIWAPSALDDLAAMYDYINQNSPAYAERLLYRILERTELLTSQPRIGRVVPEFANDNLREMIESGYRIIYRIEIGDVIQVVRLQHGSRLLTNI